MSIGRSGARKHGVARERDRKETEERAAGRRARQLATGLAPHTEESGSCPSQGRRQVGRVQECKGEERRGAKESRARGTGRGERREGSPTVHVSVPLCVESARTRGRRKTKGAGETAPARPPTQRGGGGRQRAAAEDRGSLNMAYVWLCVGVVCDVPREQSEPGYTHGIACCCAAEISSLLQTARRRVHSGPGVPSRGGASQFFAHACLRMLPPVCPRSLASALPLPGPANRPTGEIRPPPAGQESYL
jgi:hypothetical protein